MLDSIIAQGAVRTGRVLLRPSILFALATLAVHLLACGGYGFFRDELYFIVCGQRPAWGYVDQPPLVPLVAQLMWSISGGSLPIFRLAPAILMSVTVALTAEFTGGLGGGRFAQALAGLCMFGAGIFLADGTLLTTDVFQALTWLGCSWCIVRLAETGNEKWWLGFGAMVAVSVWSKYLVGFYVIGLAVGILATPLRRTLLKPWLWLGALLAAVIVFPNLLWQYQHGWPFVEIGKAGVEGKNVALSLQAYLGQQVLLLGPVAAPVWILGLWSFGIKPKLPAYRVFAIAWVVIIALAVLLHGKSYYATPIYPVLIAGGAAWIETVWRRPAVRAIYTSLLAAASLVVAPLTVPLLPVAIFVDYQRALRVAPSTGEHQKLGELPQYYADMFGWREMAEKVAAVYNALAPSDQAKAVFFGRNYGEAAAIDIFGRPLGLPPAVSGHNNYYLWGTEGHDGSVVIVLGDSPASLRAAYRDVRAAGTIDSPYAMPYETNLTIYVARGLKVPFDWSKIKHYE